MNKFEIAEQKILALLASGKFRKGDKLPSEYVLSEEFDMNRATVSKAVSSLIVKGVLKRAERSRQGTIICKTGNFPKGTLFFLSTNFYLYEMEVFKGFQAAAFANGYMTWCLVPHIDDLSKVLGTIGELAPAGICTNVKFPSFSVPCVYFDVLDLLPDPAYENSVNSDAYNGGEMIADYLIAEGKTDFIYITSGMKPGSMGRYAGFLSRMKPLGVRKLGERVAPPCFNSINPCRVRLQLMKKRFPNFNAIVCHSDFAAFECYKAALELGWDLEKIRITGFGHIREVEKNVHFPTIEEHHYHTGARACEKLIEQLEKRENANFERELLSVEFIPPGNKLYK